MSSSPSTYIAVLGDVVRSRAHEDQPALLAAVETALARVNDRLPAVQPLTPTVGDEFQGVYATLGDALLGTLLVRLHLAATCEVRFGIGCGPITGLEPGAGPAGQSGEAWWRAREAIDGVARDRAAQGWPGALASRFVGSSPEDPALDALVDGFLILRDQLLARMDEKDARITLGLFSGERQVDLAAELDLGQSTISQRQRSRGPAALVRAHESLRDALEGR